MIIKDLTLSHTKTTTTLSARCKVRKIGWDTIYFTVKRTHDDLVCKDASSFAAALLFPAMQEGEDLIIEGSISKQLYDGMMEIMKIATGWDLGLKDVKVKADVIVADEHTSTGTASFFTGGVDSFYTYLKHKNDKEKNGRIKNLIFVNGFDIDLSEPTLWELASRNVQAIADAEDAELITVTTNLYDVLTPFISWDFAHGGGLAAIGLFLRRGFSRIYIPSTFPAEEQVPYGSTLATDPLWSTEKLTFIHDGTEAGRLNKVRWQIAKSPVALKYLRVCYVNPKGAYNCGRCSKCVRTMIELYIAGALEQAETFPHTIDPQEVASHPSPVNKGKQIFSGELENLHALREQNRNPELQQAILDSMEGNAAMRAQSLIKVWHQAVRKCLYL
ncbi:MAG TPA: hypothetical protein VHQ86_05365, partial [Candidatus Saccharimonadia bacterium]|nr:hypothetical protein [Candidatus Saccharimonadia bacterium]